MNGNNAAVINIAEPPYSAIGDGVTDELPIFEQAVADLGACGGIITGPARKYRLHGTLNIAKQVALAFGCQGNGGDSVGAILHGTANAPVLNYCGPNRFVRLSGVSIVGNMCGPDQHGIVVNNGGIWIDAVMIRNCGGDGMHMLYSYAGSARNMYVSLCGGNGVLIGARAGANFWQQIVSAGCALDGLRIDSADGSDTFDGLVTEQNAGFGARLLGPTKRHEARRVFSEMNGLGPIHFGPETEENEWHFTSCGYSEPMNPVDYRGGIRNAWDGHRQGQIIRRMFAGRVGIGVDSPVETLDVLGGLAISGWRAMSYDNVTLRLGSDVSPGWSGIEMWTSGTRKAWW